MHACVRACVRVCACVRARVGWVSGWMGGWLCVRVYVRVWVGGSMTLIEFGWFFSPMLKALGCFSQIAESTPGCFPRGDARAAALGIHFFFMAFNKGNDCAHSYRTAIG